MIKKETANKKSASSRGKQNDAGARQANRLPDRMFPVVGIGASAGGMEAFERLLSALGSDIGMAFVLVQHLAPDHESILPELLAKKSRLPVIQASEGLVVKPNHVYVIPSSADLTIRDGELHLARLSKRRPRMPIDHFFSSLAEDRQNRAVGVILSGSASDGTLGLQAIKAHGGITFAQDDQTARHSGMPRSAIASGAVDFVLPPDLIAGELGSIARHMERLAIQDTVQDSTGTADDILSRIFGLLKRSSGVDFGLYKQGTIKRRLVRRMFVRKTESTSEYLALLRKDPSEVEVLFHDLLINVTGFFRDPEAFDVLKKLAFPAIMEHKSGGVPVRIWVPGCSTGEEAYSIAICLFEYLDGMTTDSPIQIFATDLAESIIQKARAGIFPESIIVDVTPDRLRRFFHKVDYGYRVSDTIRDMCVFAKQDLTRDPAFSKLDMISCRNVMIYLGSALHKRLIPLFHYALNPGGILFLGSSETVGNFREVFDPLDKKHKLYLKKLAALPVTLDFAPSLTTAEHMTLPYPETHHPAEMKQDLQRLVHQTLLNRYAPPSIVVNDNLDIVQFVGDTGPFLAPLPGDASLHLLKMVKPGLERVLRQTFEKTKKTGGFTGAIRMERILIQHSAGFKTVSFDFIPIRSGANRDQHYLIAFQDAGVAAVPPPPPAQDPKKKQNENRKTSALGSDAELRAAQLEQELESTREYLQSIIEEQRTMNEELRSANEEVQSSNEELQSINEELETAKEELQSTNEELITVNEELQNRNDQLTQVNDDLHNVLNNIEIPVIMLGNDLRIRRFNPMARKIMSLIPSDTGRPITDIKTTLTGLDLKQVVDDVIDSLKTKDIDVEDQHGRWYSMKVRPYRTADNKIDGVVLVFLARPTKKR